ncbi:MAG: YitT family protein [Clostridiales bacterium]|nr:YitT family protein [Clostridiales bacterium]
MAKAKAKKEKKTKKFQKPSKHQLKEWLIDVLLWLLGCLFYSAAVHIFTSPNHIAPGGVTGISTILNYSFGWRIGTLSLILNIPLFILARIFLGKKFIIRTAIVTTMLSVIMNVTEPFFPQYTGDKLLATLFGGVIMGIGISFIFLRGATSGGTDIIAKLLRAKWPHISMGRVILAIDFIVVVISGIVYHSIESVLYAVIAIFVSSRTIDYIMYGTGNGKMLMVVTKHSDEIAKAVTERMHRGVTILPVKGGYTGEEKNMLLFAVRSSEVAKLNKIIRSIDPNPFTIITEAGEILGEGFKLKED